MINNQIYLAGAMEFSKDIGRGWRSDYKHILDSIGYNCINPEIDNETKVISHEELVKLKMHSNKKLFKDVMLRIINKDLDAVEHSSMVLLKWDGEVTVGTFHEIGHAHRYLKPIYWVTTLSLEKQSSWLLGISKEVFPDLNEFINYLNTTNNTPCIPI